MSASLDRSDSVFYIRDYHYIILIVSLAKVEGSHIPLFLCNIISSQFRAHPL